MLHSPLERRRGEKSQKKKKKGKARCGYISGRKEEISSLNTTLRRSILCRNESENAALD